MKICDRCFSRDGSAVPAVDTLTFGHDHEILDVCESCKVEATDFIKNPPKKVGNGRKRTRKTTKKTETEGT